MAPPLSADDVRAAVGLKQDFLKRHRKRRTAAQDAWDALLDHAPRLRADAFSGTQIPKRLFPAPFSAHDNLWKLNLPRAYRAVYTVLARTGGGVIVAIEWIGDHTEYGRLFGYD